MSVTLGDISNSSLSVSPISRGRLDSLGLIHLVDENSKDDETDGPPRPPLSMNLNQRFDSFDDNAVPTGHGKEQRRRRRIGSDNESLCSFDSSSSSIDITKENSAFVDTCGSTFDESETSLIEEEIICTTKKDATELLRKFHLVPNDFVATAVIRADPSVIQRARDTLKLDKKLSMMASVVLPFVLPVFWLQRDMREMSRKLTLDAEYDIYVIGNKGFAVLNRGHLKAWSSHHSCSLQEDSTLFRSDSCAGCFRLTKARQQSVLIVSEFGTGQCQQIWFINPRTQLFLSCSAYTCQPSMAKSVKDLSGSTGELL